VLSKILAENRIRDARTLADHLIEQGKVVEQKKLQMVSR